MRAIIASQIYLHPERRGKLRALAGLGVAVAAAVPGAVAEEDAGVRIFPIPTQGDRASPEAEWSGPAIRRLFTDFRPDLVQIEEEPITRAAATITTEAARLGISVVVFSQDPDSGPGFRARRRAAKVLRAARGAIAGNSRALEHLRQALSGKPVVAMPQTGISLPPPVERPVHQELSIGYVGRLLADREVDLLLRACASIMGSWTLTIAGTGPEQESLELLAQRLGLASRVRWLGGVTRAQVEALWKDVDCLVMPARPQAGGGGGGGGAERWSLILVEAMARGVIPVVMEGGIPEALVGSAGKVARDEESLGVTLQTLRAYPDERPRLAAAARQRVLDQFVDAALAEQTLDLWERILSVR